MGVIILCADTFPGFKAELFCSRTNRGNRRVVVRCNCFRHTSHSFEAISMTLYVKTVYDRSEADNTLYPFTAMTLYRHNYLASF